MEPDKPLKKWTKEEVLDKLENDLNWVRRGLYALWNRQTAEEKKGEHPNTLNGVGFNRYDADIAGNYINSLNIGRGLSDNQWSYAREMVKRYAGQLAKIANKEI